MQTYFLTNLTLSAACCLVLFLLRDAPARARLYVCLLGLIAWLVPWSKVALPSLPTEMAIQSVVAPEFEWAMPKLPSINLEQKITNEPLFAGLPEYWWLFAIGAVGILLFLRDVTAYLNMRRHWLANSKVRNELWQDAGFDQEYCDIRYLSGTGPGMATGLFKPTIWLDEQHKGAFKTILLHELTHIQQKDPVLLWALTIIQRLLWWNPIAYLAVTYAREHIELSCDERCKSQLPDDEYRISLIEILIKNHKQSPASHAVLGLSFKPKFNLQRIYHLNEDKVMKNKDKVILLVSTLLLGWGGLSNASLQSNHQLSVMEENNNPAFNAKIQNAYQALSNSDEVGLNESLDWLVQEMSQLAPSERVTAKLFISQYHMVKNEYSEALDVLEGLLYSSPSLTNAQQQRVLKHAGDLAMATEQYEKSNEYWLQLAGLMDGSTASIKADKLAVNYYQMQEFELALTALEEAYAELNTEQPKEQKWLKLQMGIHYELGQMAQAASVAKYLAQHYPSEYNSRIVREFEQMALPTK